MTKYCPDCGAAYDGEQYSRCAKCYSELSSSKPVKNIGRDNMKNVTFLGVEGSGKTVLTTALVNVFKAHENEGWYLRPDSRESFRFLEQAPKALEGENLPHQTTALKRLAWSAQLDGQTVRTFDVLDYPGEIYRLAFLEPKDDPDPSTFTQRVESNKEDIDAVLAHLLESDQVFVLFNLADAQDISKNSANLDAVWVTNACLDYLHRLPNKPTITLLLTQIDRYADISKYELDPDVYVAHHLPLIHRNFPDLDVLAVSALGPADATYGVDSIILRCLFESPAIQSVVGELRAVSNQAYSWLDNTDLRTVTSVGVSYISDLISKCRNFAAQLPWFIPMKQLQDNGFIVDANEISDELTLLQLLKKFDMTLSPELRLDGISRTIEQLQSFQVSSLTGQKYRNKFIDSLKSLHMECADQIKQRKNFRKNCKVAIIVLGIIAIVEALFIFGRMLI